MIYNSIEEINRNIEKAAKKSGRSAEDIKLIAVTKTRTIEEMEEVKELGILDFGENRVQELETKHPKFTNDINWHLIGHLQRNKVRHIIDKVKLIHSVDSLRLAKMINKEAAKKDLVMDILIQVNVSQEESKFGLAMNEVLPLLKGIVKFENIRVKGLMTMAPYTKNPEENRKYFKELNKLAIDINSKKIDNVYIEELSMGMTNDYAVAIEEGATMIRVGTAIFGNRDY